MDSEDFLGEIHAKSYEREIDESESVWRSLPLFTVSFGFAASLLNYLVAHSRLELRPWAIVTLLLLILPTAAFAWAFRWFWDVIRIRTYRYVAADTEIRKYAKEVQNVYELIGSPPEQTDKHVLQSLKSFYFRELAESASQNQKNNHAKAKARSQVAFWLTTGFALAFLSTAIILGHEKFDEPSDKTREQSTHAGAVGQVRAQTEIAPSTSGPIRSGGSRESVPEG